MSLPASPTTLARIRRAVPVAAALLFTTALAACAPQNSSSSADLSGNDVVVEDGVTRLQDRAGKGDASGICRQVITDELKAKFAATANGDCAKGVERALLHADYTQLRVTKVTAISKDTPPTSVVATIDTIEDSGTREISLKRVNKVYLVDGFQPKPAKVTKTTPATTTPKSTTP